MEQSGLVFVVRGNVFYETPRRLCRQSLQFSAFVYGRLLKSSLLCLRTILLSAVNTLVRPFSFRDSNHGAERQRQRRSCQWWVQDICLALSLHSYISIKHFLFLLF